MSDKVMMHETVKGTLEKPAIVRVVDMSDDELMQIIGDRINGAEWFSGNDDNEVMSNE